MATLESRDEGEEDTMKNKEEKYQLSSVVEEM